MHITTSAGAVLAPTANAHSLTALIAGHTAAMAAYEAHLMGADDVPATGYAALDAARDALLAHRPATAEDAQVKLAYYLSCRCFTEWDDIDRLDLLDSLTIRSAALVSTRHDA